MLSNEIWNSWYDQLNIRKQDEFPNIPTPPDTPDYDDGCNAEIDELVEKAKRLKSQIVIGIDKHN